jgi:hypothetical protein
LRRFILAAEYAGQRVAMLQAGFHDFSGKPLGYFDGFRNAAAFGNQTGHVWACSKETTVFETLDAHSNGDFFHIREVLLPLHGVPFLGAIIPVPSHSFAGAWVEIVHSDSLPTGIATGLKTLPPLQG